MEIVLKKVTEDDIKIYSNSLIVPRGTTEIGKASCGNLHSLKNCYLPDTVTKIDEFAFAKCTSLKKIVIPASVKSIGRFAFYGCISLKEIVVKGQLEWVGQSAFGKCATDKISTPEDYEIKCVNSCYPKIIRKEKLNNNTK